VGPWKRFTKSLLGNKSRKGGVEGKKSHGRQNLKIGGKVQLETVKIAGVIGGLPSGWEKKRDTAKCTERV